MISVSSSPMRLLLLLCLGITIYLRFAEHSNIQSVVASRPKKLTKGKQTINSSKISLNYKIWRTVCFNSSGECLSFVSMDSSLFSKEKMMALSKDLRVKFPGKPKMRVFLFDDPVLAEAHAYFRVEIRSIEQDIRGLYYHDKARCIEYVKFSSERKKHWNEVTIPLQTGKCLSRRRSQK